MGHGCGSVQDGYSEGVFAQRYDSAGQPAGTEFQINTYTIGGQNDPAVAVALDGTFVVVWFSYMQDGDSWGVFGQRYDSAGQPAGMEFQINTYTPDHQSSPAVAGPDGTFVVAWMSYQQDGHRQGVFAQRFGVLPPSNDDCADATVIASLPYSDSVDVATATIDPSDPIGCDSYQGTNTVWYSYTPLTDTLLLIDTSGSMGYVPGVSVYTGTCGAPTEALCTTDTQQVLFTAQGGTTYLIEAEGGAGYIMPILVLSIEALGCPPAPDPSCSAAGKALLLLKEDKVGKEKLIAKLLNDPEPARLISATRSPPAAPSTRCASTTRAAAWPAACRWIAPATAVSTNRAGSRSGGAPPAGSGYNYGDKARESFGVFKLLLKGGAAGRSKALLKGKGPSLPDGIPAALQSSSSVTMQLHGSDALVRERDADQHQEAGARVLQRQDGGAVARHSRAARDPAARSPLAGSVDFLHRNPHTSPETGRCSDSPIRASQESESENRSNVPILHLAKQVRWRADVKAKRTTPRSGVMRFPVLPRRDESGLM